MLVFAALSLGLVFVGSCNEEIAQSIIFALMDRSDAELGDALTRLLPVALGLLYLGKQVSLNHFSIIIFFLDLYHSFICIYQKIRITFLLPCCFYGTGSLYHGLVKCSFG